MPGRPGRLPGRKDSVALAAAPTERSPQVTGRTLVSPGTALGFSNCRAAGVVGRRLSQGVEA